MSDHNGQKANPIPKKTPRKTGNETAGRRIVQNRDAEHELNGDRIGKQNRQKETTGGPESRLFTSK